MKRTKVIFLLALGIMTSSFQAFKNIDPVKQTGVNGSNMLQIVESKQLDVNNISSWYRNNGSFNRDPATGFAGFEWPKGSAK